MDNPNRELTGQVAVTQHIVMRRKLAIVGIVVVVAVIALIAGVEVFGKRLAAYLPTSLIGTTYIGTTYSNAGVTYNLQFFNHSTSQPANSMAWMTQGGRKPLAGSTTVLVSPALGKYGTGVAVFIVPIPANRQPLLQKDQCSDMPALTEITTVAMKEDGSRAVICGQQGNGKQVEYLFQFSQHGTNYDGFVLEPYDWKQVTSSPSTARAFLAYANLAKYNRDIETIISSIAVQ